MFPVGGVSNSTPTWIHPMSLEPDTRNSGDTHMVKRPSTMYLVVDVVSSTIFSTLISFSPTEAYGLVTVSPLPSVIVSLMMTPIILLY